MTTMMFAALGLIPLMVPYVLVALVPRWWHALSVVGVLAGLTVYTHLDWQAFEQANPKHGGKFAGFEVAIVGVLTAMAALGLLGRLVGSALERRGYHWIVRLVAHAAIPIATILLVMTVRR